MEAHVPLIHAYMHASCWEDPMSVEEGIELFIGNNLLSISEESKAFEAHGSMMIYFRKSIEALRTYTVKIKHESVVYQLKKANLNKP
jgi:hypothetical protein